VQILAWDCAQVNIDCFKRRGVAIGLIVVRFGVLIVRGGRAVVGGVLEVCVAEHFRGLIRAVVISLRLADVPEVQFGVVVLIKVMRHYR
jgi:hypothetical protein